MSSNQKVYINEFELLERESDSEIPDPIRTKEVEEQFSREFGAYLSSKTAENKPLVESTESSGTIYFSSVEERVRVFNTQAETKSESPGRIGEVVSEIVNEKTIQQTVEATKIVSKSIFELFKDYIFFPSKVKKEDPGKAAEEAKKSNNKRGFMESLRGIGRSGGVEQRMRQGAEQISRKLGGNLSYQGNMSESMEVRVDVETLMNKKNSELTENELRAKRARSVQVASGKRGRSQAKQEINPEKGINAGQRNAYTQAG